MPPQTPPWILGANHIGIRRMSRSKFWGFAPGPAIRESLSYTESEYVAEVNGSNPVPIQYIAYILKTIVTYRPYKNFV